MRVHFVKPSSSAPKNLLAEAEVYFDADTVGPGGPEESPFHGLRLVGFSVWSGTDDSVYVTVPGRAFGAGRERAYFDYIRSADVGDNSAVQRLKRWIQERYERDR